jgi:hypothetical protein
MGATRIVLGRALGGGGPGVAPAADIRVSDFFAEPAACAMMWLSWEFVTIAARSVGWGAALDHQLQRLWMTLLRSKMGLCRCAAH